MSEARHRVRRRGPRLALHGYIGRQLVDPDETTNRPTEPAAQRAHVPIDLWIPDPVSDFSDWMRYRDIISTPPQLKSQRGSGTGLSSGLP
jgi:hypothetical protein